MLLLQFHPSLSVTHFVKICKTRQVKSHLKMAKYFHSLTTVFGTAILHTAINTFARCYGSIGFRGDTKGPQLYSTPCNLICSLREGRPDSVCRSLCRDREGTDQKSQIQSFNLHVISGLTPWSMWQSLSSSGNSPPFLEPDESLPMDPIPMHSSPHLHVAFL